MSVKVAINGFGRIGRLSFRRLVEVGGFEIVALNDLSSPANLAYLLKYDSIHGTLHGHDIGFYETGIIFDGKKIPVLNQKDPKDLKWADFGAQLVLECTGRFKGVEDAKVHLGNGAKGVLISAPADALTPTFVYGVNHQKMTPEMTVVSGASCTTNCLAPVVDVLEKKWGIEGGFMSTIHAYTNDQTTLDLVKEGDFRRGRAAAANIVPSSTGAAKAIHLVIPEVKGRLHGTAFRVPVQDGSLIDLNVTLKTPGVTVEMINAAMKEASETYLKGVFGFTTDQIVSSDIIDITYGSLFDATQTMLVKNPEGKEYFKVVSWYDNEYSYTCQYIRLVGHMAKVLGLAK